MKIKCDKCGKDISIYVDQNFEQFNIGRIECPQCKHKQKRWLTHYDLTMYLATSCLFYVLVAYLLMNAVNWLGFKWYVFVGILGLYTLLYIILKNIDRLLYVKAPFKKAWMNSEIYEDGKKIKKSMRIEFAAYVALVVIIGTGDYEAWIFAIMSIVFTTIILVKAYFLLKNEKTSIKL